jgi:two-component system NtrC family response regulator
LIVEDDPELRRQLRWSFDGEEPLFAENREEAIAALRRYEPPVVLQDLGLPPDPAGFSEGFATLMQIRSSSSPAIMTDTLRCKL